MKSIDGIWTWSRAVKGSAALGFGLVLSLGGSVHAADSAEPVASTGELEEIVISARKTTEDLQHAAISVKVLSGDQFVGSGIKDTEQLQNRLPAVEFESSQVPSVIIRGVGTYNNQDNVDSAVAYSYDGAYISHVFGLPPVLFDLERVEAALGPQGTLQGRNSNGGLISFVTNKPKQELDASVALTEGNYGEVGTDFMLNLPLSSTTALRAAFASDRHSGYLSNDYNDAHNYGARVKLLSDPIDNLELISTVDYSLTDGKGQQFSECPPRSTVPGCAAIGWHPWAGLSVTQPAQPDDLFRTTNFGVYQEVNMTFDWATLSSLSNYRRYDSHDNSTFGPLFYSPNQIDKFYTQELRLASPVSSPIKWVGGLYYSHERLDAVDTYVYGGAPYLNFIIPGSVAKSKAVFGQVTVPVTDKLSFTGGLRYTEDYKSSFGSGTAYTDGAPITVPTGGIEQLKKVTWKGGVDYQLTPDNLLYGIASNGFKSGGVNQVPIASGVPASYGPETVTAYQLGTKNRFFNDRAQINAEAFYYDYHGYQVYVANSDPTGQFPGSFFSTANSQTATFYGGEVQSTFAITAQDRLELNLTLLHARFNTFIVGSINDSDHQVQGSPAYTLGGTLEHTFYLPDNQGEVLLEGDTKLVDGHYVDISNAPGSFQKTYTRTDARLSWSDARKKYRVSAYVRNLEGSAILQVYGGLLGPPGDLAYVYPPRTFGITVSANLK